VREIGEVKKRLVQEMCDDEYITNIEHVITVMHRICSICNITGWSKPNKEIKENRLEGNAAKVEKESWWSLCNMLLRYGVLVTQCTRVQWTPPLRESFGFPFFVVEMFLITHTLRSVVSRCVLLSRSIRRSHQLNVLICF